ncbi:hypothetical protein ACFO0N_14970 [Halobium salinum]|uniref:Uncharacterized protein n=1 Tax=Halobium salinum TaxID=1364940 RepID=A0ABD5PED6_9EURY|nr:hypothetical protein [Halobium salinum]
MTSDNDLPEDAAERLDDWFEQNYTLFPDGLEGYKLQEDQEDGVYVVLTEEFDTDRFEDLLEERDGFEPSNPKGDSNAVAAQKVEEIEGGFLYKSAFGTTFHRSKSVPLGGYEEPIDSTGEPASTSVGETLEMLVFYLEDRYA